MYKSLHSHATFSLLDPNILLNLFFSNTFNFFFSEWEVNNEMAWNTNYGHENIRTFVMKRRLEFTCSHIEAAKNAMQFDSVIAFCTAPGGIYYISVFTWFRAVIHFVEGIACWIYYYLLEFVLWSESSNTQFHFTGRIYSRACHKIISRIDMK
jgi:hypothetical protein